jgi:hypothetical protein
MSMAGIPRARRRAHELPTEAYGTPGFHNRACHTPR